MKRTVPLLGGRAVDKAFAVNAQRAVNWRPEAEPSGAKSLLTMKPTEGLVLLTTQGNGPCRSQFVEFQDDIYWVSGAQLLSRDSAGTTAVIGALNTNTGWCVLAAGRDYLMVVDGADGWTWSGSAYAQITDGDFPANPTWCAYIDGYFLANNDDTDKFYVSSLTGGGGEDPTSWSALMFATAEADPDDVLAVVKTFERVYMVGSKTTQVYYNSGNADFPFDLITNGILEWGVEAPASIDVSEGVIFLLSRSNGGGLQVIMVNGFQHQAIAPTDMIAELDEFDATSDAEGYVYKRGGQTFYQLTFPTDEVTFEYCMESGFWYERDYEGSGRHRSRGHGYFGGRHLVGDYENGNVYYLSPTAYTDNDHPIIRKRVTSVVAADGRDLVCNALELEFKRGIGLLTGQGSDPEVMLRYSTDGGNTWSDTLRSTIGALGDFDARVFFYRLGQAGSFVFEITVSDPIEAVLIAVYGDFELLAA